MNQLFLAKLKYKKESLQRVAPKSSYLEGIQRYCLSRDEVRKAKDKMKQNLTRDIKNNVKDFSKCIGDKSKTRKNVCLLLNKMRDLITKVMEKVEVLKVAFALVIANKYVLQESQVPEIRGKGWSKQDVPSVEEDLVRECLSEQDIHKSPWYVPMSTEVASRCQDILNYP